MRRFICLLCCISIVSIIYSQIVRAKSEFNAGMGFVDAKGNWIVRPQYDHTYWHQDWKLGQFSNEGSESQGLLNEWGEIIFAIGKYKKYYLTSGFIELTDMQDRLGLSTITGSVFVPCKYSDIYVSDNYIEVTDFNGNKGLLTLDGMELVSCQYKAFYVSRRENYIEVTDKKGKKGLLTIEGCNWIPCKYKDFYVSENHIKATDDDGFVGLLTKEGKVLIPFKYKDVTVFEKENIIKTRGKDGKLGAYTMQGDLLAECKYDTVMAATEKIVLVNIGGNDINYKFVGGKWGYCANGKEIIPCEYEQASIFKNDVATVKKDGEVKLIKNPLKDGSQIQIAEATSPSNKKKNGPAVSRYPAPDSDVDKNIPTAAKTADNTFAFIIANENYPDAPVPYSLNDGRMFKEYCQKALGLSEKNINLYEDATFGGIITAVEKMKSIAEAYDGEASVIFYYAGHGFPDEKQNTAYLLPIDGDASNITTTGYSLAKLYKELSGLKLKSSIVFLDACFSGAKREDQMLSQSRGVAIKVKDEAPQGNMLVFSAAQGDETAHQMEEKHHGLFTYYLLKELQATGGDVDMGTLTEYVTKQVKRQSVVINNKKQTPTVIPSQTLVDSWRTLKIGN